MRGWAAAAQLAKLIVDIATGEVEDRVDDERDPAAAAFGRKGGKARAAEMTSAQCAEIAKRAANKRRGKWRLHVKKPYHTVGTNFLA